MKKEASLGSLGLLLGGRLLGSAGSSVARSAHSPLRNFYTRMARQGFQEGFTNAGREILPSWRWPLLNRLGPASGLLDYDAARFIGSTAAKNVDAFKGKLNLGHLTNDQVYKTITNSNLYDASKKLGVRPRDIVAQYKSLPLDMQKMIRSKNTSSFSSPVFRHVSDAINNSVKLPPPTMLEQAIIPRLYGQAGKSNMLAKTVGLSGLNAGTQDAVMSGLVSGKPVHGLVQGLLTGMAESAPEAAALHAAANGQMKTLTALKSNLINTGYEGVNNPGKHMLANTIKGLDSNMREFVLAGEDLAKPLSNPADRLLKHNILQGVKHHGSPASIRSAVNEELVAPTVNRIKSFAPNLYNQLTYSYA